MSHFPQFTGVLPSGYIMRITSVSRDWDSAALEVSVSSAHHGINKSEMIPYRSLHTYSGFVYLDIVLPVARRLASEIETEREVYAKMGMMP
jgi:hypothetical protein